MSREELARVVDPEALARAPGPRGKLRVTVPAAWLDGALALEVDVPARLPCARCDGGGCDGCERSGAVRVRGASDAPDARRVTLQLAGDGRALAVRLPLPFGPDGLTELRVEVVPGDRPSPGVTRLARAAPPLADAARRRTAFALMALLALAALVYLVWRSLR